MRPSPNTGVTTFATPLQELDENGFFTWQGLGCSRLIDEHLAALSGLLQRLGEIYPDERDALGYLSTFRLGHELESFHAAHPGTQKLCFTAPLLQFARELFGDEPVLRNPHSLLRCLLPATGPEEPPHADTLSAAAPKPWAADLRLWLALEDIDPESGPVYFYPTSHRTLTATLRDEVLTERPDFLRRLNALDSRFNRETHHAVAADVWAYTQTALLRRLRELALPRVTPRLRKGDALVFRPSVVHGTTRPMTPSPSRKAMLFNLGALNAPFYPMTTWWGPLFDRSAEIPPLRFPVAKTDLGYRVDGYLATLERVYGVDPTRIPSRPATATVKPAC